MNLRQKYKKAKQRIEILENRTAKWCFPERRTFEIESIGAVRYVPLGDRRLVSEKEEYDAIRRELAKEAMNYITTDYEFRPDTGMKIYRATLNIAVKKEI